MSTSIEIREEVRESWGTRTVFVLAAIGSAVGLGNLWGFPYKLYTYGGGAFLIPYLFAMVVIGIPMLILEFSLGHLTQRAAPDAFGKVGQRFEMVGWWGIILGFVIITYYPVILAYCFSFLGYSISGIISGGNLPWSGAGIEGVNNAKSFFFDKYLGYHEGLALGKLRWNIILPLVITWTAMYLCIFRGVKLVGRIVWLTVPLPWTMLLILAIRGLTLPGAGEGIAFYLNPDWSELAKPSTWRFAFGQVFFSLSLAFGVMITYASFLHRKSDLNNNAAIIGLADLATSFVAGLAIFATLGGMALATKQAGNPVPVEKVVSGGPGLAFVAFPYALAQLPYSAWFSFVFFSALITLGIDSAFSITESVLAAIVDKTGWHRNIVLPVMSLCGLLLGLVYTTNGGLNWLGVIDAFVNGTWGIAFMGFLECVVLGWLYRIEKLRAHANERSDWQIGKWWNYLIRVIIPIVLGALVVWNLFDDLSQKGGFLITPEGGWIWSNIVGLCVVACAPILSMLISAAKGSRQTEPVDRLAILKPQSGMAGFVFSVFLGLLAVFAFHIVLSIAKGEESRSAIVAVVALATTMVLGSTAIILSYLSVERETTLASDPSWLARWAGLLATIDVGASVGLLLALKTARAAGVVAEKAAVTGAALITGPAYVVLAVISTVLILGLSWCFYRAISGDRRTRAV